MDAAALTFVVFNFRVVEMGHSYATDVICEQLSVVGSIRWQYSQLADLPTR
jgi:hypothetical protein